MLNVALMSASEGVVPIPPKKGTQRRGGEPSSNASFPTLMTFPLGVQLQPLVGRERRPPWLSSRVMLKT